MMKAKKKKKNLFDCFLNNCVPGQMNLRKKLIKKHLSCQNREAEK